MKKIYNKLIYSIVWASGFILGRMPRITWLIKADFLYIFLYRIFRYRVRVTKRNLRLSFPEKSKKELLRIERRFYLHLMDIFIETIAGIGMSKKRLSKQFSFVPNEEFEKATKEGSVIIAMSHYAAWEWMLNVSAYTDAKFLPVYHPLTSEWADKLFLNMRSRFGAEPVPMRLIGRKLVQTKNERTVLLLISDQAPPHSEKSEWVTFLNQDTMFFNGIENIAKSYKLPVFFLCMDCEKRGYYKGTFTKIYDGVEEVEKYEITRRYARVLEDKIISKPELWMWSHKRWKHKKKL